MTSANEENPLEDIDVQEIQSTLSTWLNDSILTPDAAVQAGLLLISFTAGLIVTKAARPFLNDKINNLSLPYRMSEILRSLLNLIFPAITLIVLFIGLQIAGPSLLGFDVIFSAAVSKLLLAWIVIKLLVQFIENKFVRNIIAFTVWVMAALSIFGILDDTSQTLDAVGLTLGTFRLSALTIVKALLAVFILLYGALFFSSLLESRLQQATSLTPSSRVLLSKILKVVLVTTALLIGITTAGIDLSLLAVFSGAVGLGIGFGLQKGISNLFSGMMLLLDQSIKPGDIIEIPNPTGDQSAFGWVEFMGSRYTEIITRDNKSYLIPNEQLITQQVVNWSHGNTLVRVETKFGVHYNSDPHEVKRLAEEAASKPERVVETPAPVCHLVEFGDSSLNFVLRYWIKDAEKGVTNTKGAVMLALWDAFKDSNIAIPYPHREVFIHDTGTKKSA